MGKILSFHRPLPAFAWPGGYPLAYMVEERYGRCATLCPKCATEERDDNINRASADRNIVSIEAFVMWEGPTEACEGCGADLETAYGDPDSEENHGEVPASYLSHERE